MSFVALGADNATSALIAAAESKEHKHMDDTKTTPEPTPATPTPATPSAPITASAPAAPATAPTPAEQMRVEAAAEATRIAAVRKACGGKHTDIEAKAIGEGWDATRTELEVLRAGRPSAPMAHIRSVDQGVTALVLEAACYQSAKLSGIEKLYDEKTLEAADRRFHGSVGLQELLLEAAWANGYSGRNFRDTKAVMQFAFAGSAIPAGGDIRADASTVDIGGILSNVANKFLLEGFFSVERTWRNICAVRNVNDFKTVTSYRLIGTDQYEQVAPGGELKHGTLGNETYTNKADTYGLMLGVDRRDIINDDLGAITTVPRKLGRGSGLKINDVFWVIFLNNSAFFTVGNNNYLAGVDTGLTIDGLTKSEVAFMNQVDSDGKPIGIMPSIALVPTALSAIGTQLYKSTGDSGHHRLHPVSRGQPAPGQVPRRGQPLPGQRPLHRQLHQGLVSAGRPRRPAAYRGRVPQRPRSARPSKPPRRTSTTWAFKCVAITTSAWRCRTRGPASRARAKHNPPSLPNSKG